MEDEREIELPQREAGSGKGRRTTAVPLSSSPTKFSTTAACEITLLPSLGTLGSLQSAKITRFRAESDPERQSEPEMIRYRECQRNHAAHLGGHVLDGCGEFMPAGDDGTPEALKCAACDCHRNFHRREADGETATETPPLLPLPPPTTTNCYISFTSPNHKPQKHPTKRPTLTPHHHHHPRPPVMMAFGGGAAAESSSEDLNAYRAGNFAAAAEHYGVSKKRFRTKFTAEQKEKMAEFAERIGWRIQKQNEVEVQRFLEEVGIKLQVFKVWLHNNKQSMKRSRPS